MTQVNFDSTNFEKKYPNFLLQEKSCERKICELFCKIVCGFWRTLGSYFLKAPVDKNKFDDAINKLQRSDQKAHAIHSLHRKRTIGTAALTQVAWEMGEKNSFQFVTNFICGGTTNLPEKEDKSLIYIPVVLTSFFRNHIVLFAYDKEKNCLEFYDSKGLTIKDRSDKVFSENSLFLTDVAKLIVEKYGNAETTLWENTTKHQKDCHNCGVFVLDYMERRFTETADKIAENGRSFSEINNDCRKHFLEMLL